MLLKLLVISVVLILLIMLMNAAKKAQAKKAEEVLEKFKDKKVLSVKSNANFFGQESLGYKQARGNGVLVITEEELYFEMWLPKKTFSVPLKSITSIETPKSHLGKTKGRPLLKIIFKSEKEEEDSMAWLTGDLAKYKNLLESLLKKIN